MSEQTITITQDELDELIAKRIARVRREYEADGQESYKIHSRRWEDRAKESAKALKELRTSLDEMTHDRNCWKNRARHNLSQMQMLEKVNDRLVTRLERSAK